MKINNISVSSFMRLGEVDVDLRKKNIHLFCGHNEAGKSSLQEAIRFALLGETPRVSCKRDYKLMIRDGAKEGSVAITVGDETFTRDVKTGKCDSNTDFAKYVPYVLNAPLVTLQNAKARTDFFYNLLDVTTDRPQIRRLLEKRGIEARYLENVLPMMRDGFDSAHKEAKHRSSEARAEWKALTHETYGSLKAASWTFDMPPPDSEVVLTTQQELEDVREQRQALQAKVALEDLALDCPSCQSSLRLSGGALHTLGEEPSTEEDDEREKLLAELDGLLQSETDLHRVNKALQEAVARYEKGQEIEQEAANVHHTVSQYITLAELLAPDGIPAELMADELKALNDHLRDTAQETGWHQITITPTLEILVDNRPYSLHSRSAQWRVQTLLTEAIAHRSGGGLLMLDEIDILDLTQRQALMKWMIKLGKTYQTILLFATLKESPKLPKSIAVHWMEKGLINE